MAAQEFNFDGLVGPTHNYAGLSQGNIASTTHRHSVSSPKAAALQGLSKMKFVRDLGIEQCVVPPLLRPQLDFLRAIGFAGDDAQLIDRVGKQHPVLLAVCYSASSMWAANAATVSPSLDCRDRRLHLTPANLASNLHRSLEATSTTHLLRQIFPDSGSFCVHDPLPPNMALTDEGAANHTRLCSNFDQPGIELFFYGCHFLRPSEPRPVRFPARQTCEASQAIARRHQLDPQRTLFVQQNPAAIDAGVFHNDVISVGHQNVLIAHELAFLQQQPTLELIQFHFETHCQQSLYWISIREDELPISDAVSSYLFNSQLLTLADGTMAIVCPTNCQTNERASACIQRILSQDNPIHQVHYLDLRQSMNNGGGPACLRLRVVLSERQQSRLHQGVRLTDELYSKLVQWVQSHYRDELRPDDLRDPQLLIEVRDACQSLEKLLDLKLQ